MGHIPLRLAKDLVSKGLVMGVELVTTNKMLECDTCIMSKLTKRPVNKICKTPKAEKFGEQVHSNIWGPSRTLSLGERKYFIAYTDDFSSWTTICILRLKSEAFESFKTYQAWIKKQFKCKILHFHVDRAGDFLSNKVQEHLSNEGI